MTSQQPGPLPVILNKSKGSLSRSWTTLIILLRAILCTQHAKTENTVSGPGIPVL